ncbi:MAG: alpha/beta hydrolase family protein [Armatimonadota bacterium]
MKIITKIIATTIVVLMASPQYLSASALDVGGVKDKRCEVARDPKTPCDLAYVKTKYDSLQSWEARSIELRRQVLASAGLLPMPEKTPLDAHIFGRIDRDGYTIEKVYFQSFPSLYVTGNLYRPKGDGPFPMVLNPHGHWENGRFEDTKDASIPGRCINFARQGYVAFSYDMVGYGDSWQMVHSAYPNNSYGNANEILNGRNADLNGDVLGYRRDQLLWGISVGGLQLWNSIRAVDFLQSLPYVDKGRIACTGASGGGTQTYLLSAVDERVKASAPVCMISARMQGGCLCENLPNLRIDTNNVELAALVAPRPMIVLSATEDWTREVPTEGIPAIRYIYDLLGAGDRVSSVQVDAPHNYNKESREAVYSWFGQWLPGTPLTQPVREREFTVEKTDDLRVFPDKQAPKGALDKDGLVKQLIAMSKSRIDSDRPRDIPSLDCFRKTYSPVLQYALSLTVAPDVEVEARGKEAYEGYVAEKIVLRDKARGAEIPALMFSPIDRSSGDTVLMVGESGKQAYLNAAHDAASPMVESLVKHGCQVLLIDAFGTGEHIVPDDSPRRKLQTSGGDYIWFDTYHRSDTAERVYDIVAALSYLENASGVRNVSLVGSGNAGLWCLLARAFAPCVSRMVCDAAGLDTSSDDAFAKDLYVPCLRRAGDIKTAIAVSAPGKLFIHDTQGRFDTSWAKDVYKAAGQSHLLRTRASAASDLDIVAWLTEAD